MNKLSLLLALSLPLQGTELLTTQERDQVVSELSNFEKHQVRCYGQLRTSRLLYKLIVFSLSSRNVEVLGLNFSIIVQDSKFVRASLNRTVNRLPNFACCGERHPSQ
jgi:hypothetical protein